jgi:hypothetical protein
MITPLAQRGEHHGISRESFKTSVYCVCLDVENGEELVSHQPYSPHSERMSDEQLKDVGLSRFDV